MINNVTVGDLAIRVARREGTHRTSERLEIDQHLFAVDQFICKLQISNDLLKVENSNFQDRIKDMLALLESRGLTEDSRLIQAFECPICAERNAIGKKEWFITKWLRKLNGTD